MKINTNPSAMLSQEKMKAKQREVDAFQPKFKDLLEKKDREGLKEVAMDFEELFVGMVLKTMRSSVQKSEFSNSSHELDMYESMLDESYAKSIAERGAFGVADMIMQSFEPYLDKEKGSQVTSSLDMKA